MQEIKSKADIDKLLVGDPWFWAVKNEDPEEDAAAIVKFEEELGEYVDDHFAANYNFVWTETHVEITADRDVNAQLGGDLVDRTAKFKAGKAKKCKVTAEGNGYISINGYEFEIGA